MKAHKLEIIVLDFEGYGINDVKAELEQLDSFCISVLESKTITIKGWTDEHPLNQSIKSKAVIEEYFK